MVKIYLSYSVLAEYKKCPHAFFNRYIKELVPKPWDGPLDWGSPLEFGHLLHMFMQHWLWGVPFEDVKKLVNEEAQTLDIIKVPDEANRSLLHLWDTIENAKEYFEQDPFKFWKPIVLEPEVEWKVGDFTTKSGKKYEVYFRSHFDGVAELPDGRTVVLEHKTTSQPFSQFEKRLKPNAQVSSYAHAMRHHTDWSFDGVLFTAVNTRRYKDPSKYEQVRQYMVDCPLWESDEWFEHTQRTIKKLLEDIEDGIFSRGDDPNVCTMFGQCKFIKLCSQSPLGRADTEKRLFLKEPWKGFEIKHD